jgi:hypothetical protein
LFFIVLLVLVFLSDVAAYKIFKVASWRETD